MSKSHAKCAAKVEMVLPLDIELKIQGHLHQNLGGQLRKNSLQELQPHPEWKKRMRMVQ
jgi:hypothetical protein